MKKKLDVYLYLKNQNLSDIFKTLSHHQGNILAFHLNILDHLGFINVGV